MRHSIRRRLISNLGACRNGGGVGLEFFERAERASNDTISKLYIYLPYIALHICLLIRNFVSDFGPHVALYYVEIVLFM